MSTWYFYYQLGDLLEKSGKCHGYVESEAGNLLAVLDVLPFCILGITFVFFLYYRDIYYYVVNAVLIADVLVNYSLLYLIDQASPAGADCPFGPEMPSYVTQVTITTSTLFLLMAVYAQISIDYYTAAFGYIYVGLMVYSRVIRNISTPNQLLAGALVGAIDGTLGFLLMQLLVRPLSRRISRMKLATRLGLTNRWFYPIDRDALLMYTVANMGTTMRAIMTATGFSYVDQVDQFMMQYQNSPESGKVTLEVEKETREAVDRANRRYIVVQT